MTTHGWMSSKLVSYFFCYMKCTSMLSSYTTRFKQGYTKNKTTPYMTRYFFCVAFIMFKLYLYFYYQPKKLCQVKLFHADKVNSMPCGITIYIDCEKEAKYINKRLSNMSFYEEFPIYLRIQTCIMYT